VSVVRATTSFHVHLAIDRRDLTDPAAAVPVLQTHDLLVWPVEVIGEKGYLPVELVEGVA